MGGGGGRNPFCALQVTSKISESWDWQGPTALCKSYLAISAWGFKTLKSHKFIIEGVIPFSVAPSLPDTSILKQLRFFVLPTLLKPSFLWKLEIILKIVKSKTCSYPLYSHLEKKTLMPELFFSPTGSSSTIKAHSMNVFLKSNHLPSQSVLLS